MAHVAEKTTHPYIVSDKDYCGASPVIRGTKLAASPVVVEIRIFGIHA